MGIIMKALTFSFGMLACVLLLSACNTVNGFGKDLKATGEQLESVTGRN
jgi:predicted small secreted protein